MVSGGLYALLGVVLAAVAYWRKVRVEEHYLHQAFGDEYAEYSRITPAYSSPYYPAFVVFFSWEGDCDA